MNNSKITMGLTNTLNDTVDELSNTLINMETRVTKDGQLIQRLKWPFTEKENEKYLSSLERYKSILTLALTIIQTFILTAFLEMLISCSQQSQHTDERVRHVEEGVRQIKLRAQAIHEISLGHLYNYSLANMYRIYTP